MKQYFHYLVSRTAIIYHHGNCADLLWNYIAIYIKAPFSPRYTNGMWARSCSVVHCVTRVEVNSASRQNQDNIIKQQLGHIRSHLQSSYTFVLISCYVYTLMSYLPFRQRIILYGIWWWWWWHYYYYVRCTRLKSCFILNRALWGEIKCRRESKI